MSPGSISLCFGHGMLLWYLLVCHVEWLSGTLLSRWISNDFGVPTLLSTLLNFWQVSFPSSPMAFVSLCHFLLSVHETMLHTLGMELKTLRFSALWSCLNYICTL